MADPVSSNRITQLNLYFRTKPTAYADAVQYIQNNVIPAHRDAPVKRMRFCQALEGLQFRNGKLYEQHMEVLPDKAAADAKILEYYHSNPGLGLGVNATYDELSKTYINLTREDVHDVLFDQPAYAQRNNYADHAASASNRPVISTHKNSLWIGDLIDYGPAQREQRYCFNVVDHFTGKLWSRSMRNKNTNTTTAGLQSIVAEAGNVYPKRWGSDQGNEWEGTFRQLLENNGCRLVLAKSYYPKAFGKIEAINRIVRRNLTDWCVRNQERRWFRGLADVVNGYNQTSHNGLDDKTPNQLYDDNIATDEMKQQRKDTMMRKIREQVAKNHSVSFKKDDKVIVKLTALYSEARKLVKSGKKKHMMMLYTNKVYTVDSVINTERVHQMEAKPQYTLRDPDDNIVLSKEGIGPGPLRVFATDLKKAPTGKPTKPERANLVNWMNKSAMVAMEVAERLGDDAVAAQTGPVDNALWREIIDVDNDNGLDMEHPPDDPEPAARPVRQRRLPRRFDDFVMAAPRRAVPAPAVPAAQPAAPIVVQNLIQRPAPAAPPAPARRVLINRPIPQPAQPQPQRPQRVRRLPAHLNDYVG